MSELAGYLENLKEISVGNKTKAALIIELLEECGMLPPVDKSTDRCVWEKES